MSGSEREKYDLLKQVETALDYVRPHLAVDGGNVEVVEITEDNVLIIKWLGACQNCGMTQMTLRAGIEEVVRSKVPSISGVEAREAVS